MRRRLVDVFRLHALGRETDQSVAHSFHFSCSIDIRFMNLSNIFKIIWDITINGSFSGQNDNDELKTMKLGLQISEHGLHLFHPRRVLAKTRLAHNRHASVVGYTLKLLGEIPKRLLVAVALLGETSNRPDFDLDTSVKLFASHVPHALIGQHGHFSTAAILDLGGGQDAALDVRHLLVDRDAEVAHVRVFVEFGAKYEAVYLLFAVRCRTRRRFDHGRRLHVG